MKPNIERALKTHQLIFLVNLSCLSVNIQTSSNFICFSSAGVFEGFIIITIHINNPMQCLKFPDWKHRDVCKVALYDTFSKGFELFDIEELEW
jgi:hypothetical protein